LEKQEPFSPLAQVASCSQSPRGIVSADILRPGSCPALTSGVQLSPWPASRLLDLKRRRAKQGRSCKRRNARDRSDRVKRGRSCRVRTPVHSRAEGLGHSRGHPFQAMAESLPPSIQGLIQCGRRLLRLQPKQPRLAVTAVAEAANRDRRSSRKITLTAVVRQPKQRKQPRQPTLAFGGLSICAAASAIAAHLRPATAEAVAKSLLRLSCHNRSSRDSSIELARRFWIYIFRGCFGCSGTAKVGCFDRRSSRSGRSSRCPISRPHCQTSITRFDRL
jgi:hypothetical protein